jgi:uncharacterized membrane protein (DUF4010 family)
MATHNRNTPSLMRVAAAGAALWSVGTAVQLVMILYLANHTLANDLLPVLLIVVLVTLIYGVALAWQAQHTRVSSELPGRAFELKRAAGFALMVTVVMFMSAFLADRYGAAGASLGVALAGFADAHSSSAAAATLLAAGNMSTQTAVLAILLAVSANTLTKAVIAFAAGGIAFGLRVVPGLILMMIALWAGAWLIIAW